MSARKNIKTNMEDSAFYEVQQLLDKRTINGVNEYLVKWKNYSIEEATWQPEKNIQHLKLDLYTFNRKHQQKIKPKSKEKKSFNRAKSIRQRNERKIFKYLNDKQSISKRGTRKANPESQIKLQESLPLRTDQTQQQKEYSVPTVLELTKSRDNSLMFKVAREKEILLLSERQTQLLFPAQLSLFYEERIKKLMLNDNDIYL